MEKRIIAILLCVTVLMANAAFGAEETEISEMSLKIENLRTQNLENPIGIDTRKPLLSYTLSSEEYGQYQTAYRIIVASSQEKLDNNEGDLWDSGKVFQRETFAIPYEGKPLQSRQRVYWKVMVWDKDGHASAWSEPAFWEMGLLDPSDWKAKWIGQRAKQESTSHVIIDTFSEQTARYLKLSVFETGPYAKSETNAYRLQIMEVCVSNNGGENLALNKSATTNDEFVWNTQWRIANLTDGDTRTKGYSSSQSTSPVRTTPIEIVLDLGQLTTFNEIQLFCRTDIASASGSVCPNYPKRYRVLTSSDGVNYTEVYSKTVANAPTIEKTISDAAPLFVKEFAVRDDRVLSSARLYISGLGLYVAYINGEKLGNTFFDPGETDYRKRVQYVTYDVTEQLQMGNNAVAFMLGNGIYRNYSQVYTLPERYQKTDGWREDDSGYYGPLKGIAQLEITYKDGTKDTIVTDDSWYFTDGPITFNNWYGGEDYDATKEIKDWNIAGIPRDTWSKAALIDPPNGELVAREYPPIRIVEELTPVSVEKLPNGNYLVDMGRNGAGFEEIILKGTTAADAGVAIKMYPAELLNSDRSVNQYSCTQGDPGAIYDTYVIKGTGDERWHPVFTYHGYRYLEVVNFPGVPTVDNFKGYLLRTDNKETGTFYSSDISINTINTIIKRSIESNMYSSLTDCPHIEKLGWLEVTNLMFYSISQSFDIAAWMRKIVQDVIDSQYDEDIVITKNGRQFTYKAGYVPAIAPEFQKINGLSNDPNWGGVCVLVPWDFYEVYGDTSLMAEAYPTMVKYVKYLETESASNNYLINFAQMGDWGAYDKTTPKELVASCAFYNITDTLSKTAKILGKDEDCIKYRELAEKIKKAINDKYYNASTGVYGSGSQASYACPLYAGIVDEENIPRVLNNLVEAVKVRDYHISTGEVALKQMFAVLGKYGRNDVVYKMATNRTRPSYWYFVTKGATTLPEYWDMARSQNHAMMGHVKEWFTRYLAGIDPVSPGYREFAIKPYVPGDLKEASASVTTPYGEISSSWSYAYDKFKLNVKIPVGTTATVYIPKLSDNIVTMNNITVPAPLTDDGKYYEISNVGSGSYTFGTTGSLEIVVEPSEMKNYVDYTIAADEKTEYKNTNPSNPYRIISITASSDVPNYGWGVTNANDGYRNSTPTNGWSSAINKGPSSTAWIKAAFNETKTVNQIVLWPRNDSGYAGEGFPVDFEIQASIDNVNWTTLRTITKHPSTVNTTAGANLGYCFFFSPVECRYIRVNATKLEQAGSGSNDYCFQLAEIEVANDEEAFVAGTTAEIDAVYQNRLYYAMDDDFYKRLAGIINGTYKGFSETTKAKAELLYYIKYPSDTLEIYNSSTNDHFGVYCNGVNAESGYRLILAQYNAENKLLFVKTRLLTPGSPQTLYAKKESDGSICKAFIWKDGIKPAINPLIIK